jgi:hypothetical protein
MIEIKSLQLNFDPEGSEIRLLAEFKVGGLPFNLLQAFYFHPLLIAFEIAS